MLIAKTQFPATFNLAGLTPQTGFMIDGVHSGDQSGYSVSAAGDINHDGIADLIIGAPYANSSAGASYVVFGAKGIGRSTTFALSDLNGVNGFAITGINSNDQSGYSVSAAGDVNGDGIADLIIGAPGVNSYTGASYVVFGAKDIGHSWTFALSSLNGTNGFAITGINSDDSSGRSVSAAGDVNADGIADLIIGANSGSGVSYVVFGAKNIAQSGMLSLSNLNGTNGFAITGIVGYGSISVSTAGDVNADGIADLIIGTCVIFGAKDIAQSGMLSFSNLNGTNGFVITEVDANMDVSSSSVSAAGDVNADGIADLIIGASGFNRRGRSYVVFGARNIGSSSILALSSLNGQNGFSITGISQYDQSGYSVSTAGDINHDGITDLIIGAPGVNNSAGASYVVFGDTVSFLTRNTLTIDRRQTLLLNNSYLNATYLNVTHNPTIRFSVSNIQHGYFSLTDDPSVQITSFLQQDISRNVVAFTHDGSQFAPAFSTQIGDGGLAFMIPRWAEIVSTLAFSMVSTQFPVVVPLSTLTPEMGFSIAGAIRNGHSGSSVSAAGDINHDGIADLVIGASGVNGNTGISYVIFGARGIGNLGILALSSLNGLNGFSITGISQGDQSGYSVSAAGDINHDGIADLIIGAPGVANSTGASYVVFGARGIGSSGTLSLSSLNGLNGFNITGVSSNDQSGYSVSAAGDINNDGVADLIIGAPGVNDSMGASYVVFGARGIGSSGTLALSNLNGSNGFNMTGVLSNGYSGSSVSSAGDINSDGIADLIIGAPNSQAGASYVVFGAKDIGNSSVLALSSLNGINGFTITGINSNDQSGSSVSFAGDVNADGIADLIIGAPAAGSYMGNSYVVFGARNIGSSGTLAISSLNGLNGFSIYGNMMHDRSGSSVSAAGDINNDGIADLIIGAPSVNAQEGTLTQAGTSYVVFGARNIGSSGTLEVSSLNGYNGLSITGVSLGDKSGYSVSAAGDVNHDGIADLIIGTMPFTDNRAGDSYVVFGNSVSILINNMMMITKGETVLLTSSQLSAVYALALSDSPTIRFTITNIQYGHFSVVNNPSVVITTFLQQDILNQQIQFTHDNSGFPPAFSTQLLGNGGLASMSPQPASITFIHQGGKLIHNTLTIDQGKTATVLFTELTAVNLDNPAENPQLIFLTDTPQHGYFQYNYNPGFNITQFNLNDVRSGFVQFVQDGSNHTPSYNVSVNDGTSLSSFPEPANITFYLSPMLVNNTFTIKQAESVILTSSELGAFDPGISTSNLVFTATDLAGGYFQEIAAKTVTDFTQAQINNASIAFVQEGSSVAPKYTLFLSNSRPGVTTGPFSSNVTFIPEPQTVNTAVRDAIIGSTVGIGGAVIALLIIRKTIDCYVRRYQHAELSEAEVDLLDFKETISPIVTHIFDHIKTTGFMGYRSNDDTTTYREAIESLMAQLADVEVDIKTEMSTPEKKIGFLDNLLIAIKTCIPKQTSYAASFFKPEVTADQFRENARKIALEVKRLQENRVESVVGRDSELNERFSSPLLISSDHDRGVPSAGAAIRP